MEQAEPTDEELQFLDQMMYWKNGMTLEQPNLPFTYEMIGLTLDMLKSIAGEGAVKKMICDGGLHGSDVVSLQVRQLLDHQVNVLAHKLAVAEQRASSRDKTAQMRH